MVTVVLRGIRAAPPARDKNVENPAPVQWTTLPDTFDQEYRSPTGVRQSWAGFTLLRRWGLPSWGLPDWGLPNWGLPDWAPAARRAQPDDRAAAAVV